MLAYARNTRQQKNSEKGRKGEFTKAPSGKKESVGWVDGRRGVLKDSE